MPESEQSGCLDTLKGLVFGAVESAVGCTSFKGTTDLSNNSPVEDPDRCDEKNISRDIRALGSQ